MARHHLYAQHFLRSPRLVAELVGHSNLRKNDTVYDLGAGSGVIASVLARRAKQVIAIETEPDALKKLRANASGVDNISIVKQDILDVTPSEHPYKIFSNIPFNLSTPVVRKFTETIHPPKSIYLIVQKQFARKLVPGSNHFTSQLSAEISPWFSARIRKPLRRTDFTPPPNVDTVLLEIKPLESPFLPSEQAADYRTFIAKCFQEQAFFRTLQKPFSAELRPSQLTPKQWVALYRQQS